MKINRRTGRITGKVTGIVPTTLLYDSKFGQLGRRLAPVIRMPMTAKRVKGMTLMEQISAYSYDLTPSQRNSYAEFFTTTGRDREVHDSARYAPFMPYRILPGSWLGGFFFCNLIAAHSKMTIPRMKTPYGGPPMTPSVRDESVRIDLENWKITGEIMIYSLFRNNKENRLRLWVAFQYGHSARGFIYEVYDIGAGPQTNVVVPFTIDKIRTAGYRFGIEELKLKDMLFGKLYIFADCVAAHGPEWGPLPSSYSNVVEVFLPRRVKHKRLVNGNNIKYIYVPKPEYKNSVSKLSMKVLNYVKKYMRKVTQRYKAKVIMGVNWSKFKYK